MAKIARTIFEAMVRNLNLDSAQSHSNLSESTGFVRVYRYPKFSKANEALGMEVHTDSSVLSILNEDQVGGLEVFKDDKWLLVQPIPSSLIVNLGDMMQVNKCLLPSFIYYIFMYRIMFGICIQESTMIKV